MTPKRRYLPVSYDVAAKPVGVVGNGMAALAKLDLLTRTQARITLYSPAPHRDLVAAASAAEVVLVSAYPTAADLAGMALLFLATEDAAEDERLAVLARAAGVAINAVDRPYLTDFAMPSIVDRGSVTVAIASDGAAPVLTQRVRALIDALLPATLANLGELARAIRASVLDRLPGNAARRRFWWHVLDGRAGAVALSGDIDRARDLALNDLGVAAERVTGKVFFVYAPESADLLTLRAQRLMLCADTVVHDSGVPADLLAIARRDARHIPADADPAALLIRLARSGQHVIRLAASFAEIAALRHAGIEHELVPGITAVVPMAPPLAA